MGLCEFKKLLHSKGNNYQSEDTAYRMEKKSLSDIHSTGD
jgi:hypothetical protein